MRFMLAGIVTVAAAATVVGAGPLNPPAGAVAPTMKTLAQVEPRIAVGPQTTPPFPFGAPSVYTINQPGSYYLTGNVVGESGKIGIRIMASDVTLDLNGFTLQGVAGSRSGIATDDFAFKNVTIRNGVIRGWGQSGISPESYIIEGWRVEGVTAEGNAQTGIGVGRMGVVRDCSARGNGGAGIAAGIGSVVEGCVANNNEGYGVSVIGATVSNSSAQFNTGGGFFMFSGGMISGCNAQHNTGPGITAESEVHVVGNTCRGNGASSPVESAGIRVIGTDNRIEGNTLINNDWGIWVGTGGNFIVKNIATGNPSGNYSTVGQQTIGPIVTAGGTITNTNPWANFSY